MIHSPFSKSISLQGGLDEFACADEDQQHQAQRDARWLEHPGFVTRCQKCRLFVGVEGRKMPSAPGLENVLHVDHQIAFRESALEDVAEDLRTHRL
jgi:hypothetical protein